MKIVIVDERKGNYYTDEQTWMVDHADLVLVINSDDTVRVADNENHAVLVTPQTEAQMSMAQAQRDKARRLGEHPASEYDRESSMTKVYTALGTSVVDQDRIDLGEHLDGKSDPRQKHDDACLHRKKTHPFLCTCGMTDAQVVAAANGKH
jgi:hypothetical protein